VRTPGNASHVAIMMPVQVISIVVKARCDGCQRADQGQNNGHGSMDTRLALRHFVPRYGAIAGEQQPRSVLAVLPLSGLSSIALCNLSALVQDGIPPPLRTADPASHDDECGVSANPAGLFGLTLPYSAPPVTRFWGATLLIRKTPHISKQCHATNQQGRRPVQCWERCL